MGRFKDLSIPSDGPDVVHDPLCPTVTEPHGVGYDCECDCLCDLIAKVREDERDKDLDYRYIAAQAEAQGQRDMLAKCITAVEEKDAAGTAQGWDLHISDVLAALRALQEKQ